MAAGLCGIPRITLHPIPCLDPSLVLLPQVLLTTETGLAPIPTSHMGNFTLLNLTMTTTQVDYMLENKHKHSGYKEGKYRTFIQHCRKIRFGACHRFLLLNYLGVGISRCSPINNFNKGKYLQYSILTSKLTHPHLLSRTWPSVGAPSRWLILQRASA